MEQQEYPTVQPQVFASLIFSHIKPMLIKIQENTSSIFLEGEVHFLNDRETVSVVFLSGICCIFIRNRTNICISEERSRQENRKMDRKEMKELLDAFEKKRISKPRLLEILFSEGFFDLGHTKVDFSRLERIGFPEVVFCKNKQEKEVVEIATALYKRNGFVLLTKANRAQFETVHGHIPESVYHERPGIIVIGKGMEKRGFVSVLSGGTSDFPVAEEAAITSEVFGCNVSRIYDVGVAGIHRLLSYKDTIEQSNVIIAIAGMEGALPSVVGGLFGIPIIGVPTSVGYGASFHGVTPLLTMLNSCAPGVSVVNIDNGFGAGYLASLINRKIEDARAHE